ncbi:hypothetical protein OsI_36213 [Oryza sativa Indica Group]|nr:hypothetical protein OsI_36213 [Oryza sativa Indica Group]
MEEAHDAQEDMMTPSPAQDASQLADDAPAAVDAVDMEENEMAPGSPRAEEEHGVEAEPKPEVEIPVPEAGTEMEVDGGQATGGEAETEKAVEQVVGGEMQEAEEEAEGEWEMVTAESPLEAAAADDDVEAVESSAAPAARVDEPAVQDEEKEKEEGVEMKKVMEMVAALCERSAQQCAVIGALAERVDALERAVRRVEESDRRRRRNKKLKKEAKANS